MKSQMIRILFIEDRDSGWWSAQCLEFDLAAQAKTFHDLVYEIQRVVAVHVMASRELGMVPFADLKQAPPVFWQMVEQAEDETEEEEIPFTLMNAPIPSLIADFMPA
jgi:hypothetical protein